MIGGILLFALGSAITAASQNIAMAIGGRSVQGVGGGAILTMVEIVVCDLVPLAERGNYFGAIGAVWALVRPLLEAERRATGRALTPSPPPPRTGFYPRPAHWRRTRYCRSLALSLLL